MDVRLPIYKAIESSVVSKANEFDISLGEPVTLPMWSDLTPGEEYSVSIDYYTGIKTYVALFAGDTLLVKFDESGETHKMQTSTFVYPSNGGTLRLVLFALMYDVSTAHVSEIAIRRTDIEEDAIRYVAEAWEFHDTIMGERYVTLTATFHSPINWQIGDYVIYRGQRYFLNTIPNATQNGRSGEAGDSFVYENLKFDGEQGKMYDCMVLDITPTTGDYVAAKGTNYTGSSTFTILCAETTVQMQDMDGNWHDVILSPVAYLAGLAQANLNRLYPTEGWRIDVNPELPPMDDKVVSINKWYVPQLLAEIHNQWKVDYVVIGRTIKVGYTLNNITGGDNEAFLFGYGEGYAQRGDDGKSLFQIRRTYDPSRRIITRLRAMGSTRNMPYRYYNKKYLLPQSMFVMNLQLPDTFATPMAKAIGNANRDEVYGIGDDGYPNMRHVLGDSNDAYVDKHDNAASCLEGIREGAAAWDGSDPDLEEIYPTIKSGTYRDLRAANIPDMSGRYPATVGAQNAYPGYDDDERIDEILDVDSRTNIGDGIMTENDAKNQFNIVRTVRVSEKSLLWSSGASSSFDVHDNIGEPKEQFKDTLFTINDVVPGKYQIEPVTQNVKMFIRYEAGSGDTVDVRYRLTIFATDKETEQTTKASVYMSDVVTLTSNAGYVALDMPSIPNVEGSIRYASGKTLEIRNASDVRVEAHMEIAFTPDAPYGTFYYKIDSDEPDVEPEYIWGPQDVADTFLNTPFSIFIKDIGIDLSTIQTTGEDAIIHMNTGACGGMEFKWNPNTVQKVLVEGREAWKLEITERYTDDTIHVYYPNAESPLLPGDDYVLLNIEFPEVYIKLAELRLLDAATKYLADNCEPKYVYEPFISEIYIQRNIDYWEALGAPASSVYWNLYAGFKFSMRGIPNTDDEILPIIDNVTIKTVTIKEGEQDVPIVELVLNDELEQSTIQKLTVSVDRIYNGLFGGGNGSMSSSALVSLLVSEGEKMFLSKRKDDEAQGLISFNKGLESKKNASFGSFSKDSKGAGIYEDGDGNWHVESDFLHVRKKLTAKEVQVEDVSHIGGQQLLTAARMTCDFVVEFDTFWRCYFLRYGDNNKEIKNQWKIGDQAYVCTFNLERKEGGLTGNHYLWRRVVGTSNEQTDTGEYEVNGNMVSGGDYHFIDLSKTIAGAESDEPYAGDDIVQLGYQDNDPDRENAIIIAGAGTNSPYIRQYTGITSFTLPEPDTQFKPGENKLTGQVTMQSGSTFPDGSDVEEYLDGMASGNENLLLNTGFTGDFESRDTVTEGDMKPETPVFSDPLKYWNSVHADVVVDAVSASGFAVNLTGGMLSQDTTKPLEATETYCLSFRASGATMRVSVCGHSEIIPLDGTVRHYVVKFTCDTAEHSTLVIDQATAHIMEIQLTKGTIPNSDWLPSPLDNSKAVSYFQSLSYLKNAINDASTSILGGLILSQIIQVGNYRNGVMTQETGGMSGVYSSNNSPFLWGGGTMEKAFYTIGKYAADPSYQPTDEEVSQMAKFVVTHGGRAILNDIILRGYIYALGGFFRGEIQATGGSFQSSNNGNTISINASDGDFRMSGPGKSIDSPGWPPDPSAAIVEFLKIAFETDPDSLLRFASFVLNSALGYKVEISAIDGIKVSTPNGDEITIKDDLVRVECEFGQNFYLTEITGSGGLRLYNNKTVSHGVWWKEISIEHGGVIELTLPDGTTTQGTLTVTNDGFLKLVNRYGIK